MNYCGNCGHSITLLIPKGDDRERHCCGSCGSIHYINPRIIVGCLPIWEDKIILCKRGIEPRLGYWTLPAGFMEIGETTEQGAKRETWEETRADVDIESLYGIYNLPDIDQVYMIYLARMTSEKFELTPESTQIELVKPNEIPWDNIAFKVVAKALKQYVDEEPFAHSGFHHEHIEVRRSNR